jgi:hypothetical protein
MSRSGTSIAEGLAEKTADFRHPAQPQIADREGLIAR